MFNKSLDLDEPNFKDLVTTVTETQPLWNEFRLSLRKNNIVTNVGSAEYLHTFVKNNQELIEEHYYISILLQKEDPKTSNVREGSNTSDYFGNMKKRISFAQKKSNSLCDMILQNCKNEINHLSNQNKETESRVASSEYSYHLKRSCAKRKKKIISNISLEGRTNRVRGAAIASKYNSCSFLPDVCSFVRSS